jgi:8-oxo-dGTP pyrophosphatase MutT (NUDIX family)
VRDDAAARRPDDGFLHLRRLTLVNVYGDGARSSPYPCDMVSRARQDAVAVVVWGRGGDGQVHVVLRENLRPPVHFRRQKTFVQPDAQRYTLIGEIVAGLIEPGDEGPAGVERRAVLEVAEEVGWRVEAADIRSLGAPLFASPGITDEKIHFRHVEVDLTRRGAPTGDGSVMEEAGRVLVLPLVEALARCRSGAMPDMKTEVGLGRLRDLVTAVT